MANSVNPDQTAVIGVRPKEAKHCTIPCVCVNK